MLVAAGICVLGAGALRRSRIDAFQSRCLGWTTGLQVLLPNSDSVTVGWEEWGMEVRPISPADPVHYCFLIWRTEQAVREYLITPERHHLDGMEFRAELTSQHPSEPFGRLWLVWRGEVIASLDGQTGRFVSRCGWVVDPSMSRVEQRRVFNSFFEQDGELVRPQCEVAKQPAWATPRGGELVARIPEVQRGSQ